MAKNTEVRVCACGHYYVGDHGCPECGAPWLLTSRIMIAVSRKVARLIAAECRANGKRAVEHHKGGRFGAEH